MNARIYFRGKNKSRYTLVTGCPSLDEATIFAIRKFGQSVDLVQDVARPVHEGKNLIETIEYETI